ncbi:MAG: CaiB/BaiF CoA-transferase family protein [Pseudomonadales bacterium]|jgi:alpha-methylacyl-CoA racemase|nr:CaiB/BaiF CoA-transferase family protein [Pseudomonadales bacterium]MDP6472500.1 CaiB/BaiF CoA-transferase family protein [Pseudomonadales bacterium]MDP6828689.1 CaiB/BaiF CoA-transferase family protein [Pseudomonadales bacterium]MDP6970409.1 CaiB/BaiF CoA-transferase family protein [Pseudomonadales bacterium]
MGPLSGLKVIELQGIGPGPFCGMMLADMGADVVRIDRAASIGQQNDPGDVLARGRRSAAVDLKNPDGVETVLKLLESADALIEGFRPGVMERLGLGPEICLERNPRLVYGRMTGWGQEGTLARAAGHDINYISLTGALHAIGNRGERPAPPLNLVGDFGGGGMFLAFGILAALHERTSSGKGQVVDAAMTDGSAILMNAVYGLMNSPHWKHERASNLLDGGAHFYGTYETADGKWISIGSIEPQFYALLLEKTGLDGDNELPQQMERAEWPAVQEKLQGVFKTKTRDEWDEIMLGSDVCYAPVLNFDDALVHPHNIARSTFVDVDGVHQAAPAPRFDRTPAEVPPSAVAVGANTDDLLADAGLSVEEISALRASGAVA